MGVHVKINFLRLTACEISKFKCICTMIFTFNLEDQCHILFHMVDYAGYMLNPIPTTKICKISRSTCICVLSLAFDLES